MMPMVVVDYNWDKWDLHYCEQYVNFPDLEGHSEKHFWPSPPVPKGFENFDYAVNHIKWAKERLITSVFLLVNAWNNNR